MNKYYTPDIEEFRVGFEYEDWDIKSDENWIKRTVPNSGYTKHPHEEVRVKHLDREDIESLGWEYLPSRDSSFSQRWWDGFTKGEFMIKECCAWDHGNVVITKGRQRIFQGNVKNKSELERVIKNNIT